MSIVPGLARATFWEPDEPRFAEATRQMFVRSDFATPYFNGVPRFEKPILMYWLQAGAFAVGGANELTARLPAALAGIGTVLFVFLIARRMASLDAALVSAITLATMFRFVVQSRQGLTDIPVLFFVTAALYGFIRANEGTRSAVWAAWTAVGLGILMKGPVGLLAVLIWGAYAVVRRDRSLVVRIHPIGGLAIAVLIGLPWYLVMAALHGRSFVDFALGHEIVSRVLSEATFAPPRPPFYYVKIWLGDAAPWSLLFIVAATWFALRWRRLESTERQPIVFALTWFASVFVLFSLSRSKLPHYILPAYPAAALTIGLFVDALRRRPGEAAWWRLPMAAIATIVFVVAVGLAWSIDTLMPEAAALERWIVPLVVGGGAAAVVIAIARSSVLGALAALACALSLTFAAIGDILVPRAIEEFKPMPRLARAAEPLLAPGRSLGLLGRYGASSLIYYSHHNVSWLETGDETVRFLRDADAVVVLPRDDFARLAPLLPPSTEIVASGEEFNVRLDRLLTRKRTPGRQWVLVRSGARNSSAAVTALP